MTHSFRKRTGMESRRKKKQVPISEIQNLIYFETYE